MHACSTYKNINSLASYKKNPHVHHLWSWVILAEEGDQQLPYAFKTILIQEIYCFMWDLKRISYHLPMTFALLKMWERNRNRAQKTQGSMEWSGHGTSMAPKPTLTLLAGRPTIIQHIDPWCAGSNPTGEFPFCSAHTFFSEMRYFANQKNLKKKCRPSQWPLLKKNSDWWLFVICLAVWVQLFCCSLS